jgi:hypothetical protein
LSENKPKKNRPVVKVRLHCHYCAHVFWREYTAADSICAEGPLLCIRFGRRVLCQMSYERGWWLWRKEIKSASFEVVREACENCGKTDLSEIEREPITA